MIVDDTPANLQLLSEIFKDRGYEIRAAFSGRLALQSIQSTPPDLVLLDINMPDISGYEVCKQMKANPALKDIPIIFVSGLHDTPAIVKAFDLGGVDYVIKPFQIKEILARVQTHLELRRQRSELQEANLQLHTLEELRDNLVHMIVHDMRNPLWNTHGYLQMILAKDKPNLPASTVDNLNEAIELTQRLMTMTNTILDVSRMESGLMSLQLSECNLATLVQEVINKASLVKKSRVLDLTVSGDTTVMADPALITRVLDNLLSNAMAYTSETTGEIHFSIDTTNDKIRVGILDNGQGIPLQYQEKIFEKFFQIQSALNGQRHSTGLGLTFCQLAVEAHGGRIGVQSKRNAGSLFWFELPAKGPAPA